MIPFVRALDFAYGRVDQVSPLIRRVIANNPGPLTFTGTGTYIIGKTGPNAGVAVIDPGPMDEAHLAALLNAVQGQAVSHIFLTHTHRDHAPLARPFATAIGAKILAALPPRQTVHVSSLEEGEDDGFAPDVILKGGDVIQGDDWCLEVMATPGHASNHLAFVLRDENALFSGDHVMGWSTTVVAPPDGDMTAYMSSLDTVIARRFASVWPTHGGPILEPEAFLTAYRQHRLDRDAQIVEHLKSGPATITDVVGVLYAAVDRRLWPAASLTVWAHLIALEKAGRAKADPMPDIDAMWRLA